MWKKWRKISRKGRTKRRKYLILLYRACLQGEALIAHSDYFVNPKLTQGLIIIILVFS